MKTGSKFSFLLNKRNVQDNLIHYYLFIYFLFFAMARYVKQKCLLGGCTSSLYSISNCGWCLNKNKRQTFEC